MSLPLVRRRLAGKNAFSLEEISVICEKLDIPPGEVFYSKSRRPKHPLEFFQYDFNGYEQESNTAFDQSINMITFAAGSDDSKIYISCNTLPNLLNPTFEWLERFAALQWIFFAKGSAELPSLTGLSIDPGLQDRLQKYLLAIRSLKKSICLAHNKIIENYLTDIRRFFMLGYLTKEEVRYLISDIDGALKLFEKVCNDGCLENGKEMEIYCTGHYFSNDMYIVESDRIHFALFQPNQVNPIMTKSPDICRTMTNWFKLWRRSATLISQSGTHIRRQFMETQYQALEEFNTYIESEF